ncbi:MAG: spondin domain-containing protein [Halioglobus sp.]
MLKQTLAASALVLFSGALAAQTAQYEVTITNLTPGQTFTPQLVMTHSSDFSLFDLGRPASVALEILAEGGDTSAVADDAANFATETQTIGALLGPGEETSITISGPKKRGFFTVAAMMIPTNDTFIAANRVALPTKGSLMSMLFAYDAGTEMNDQNCLNMPGPRCGGIGYSPDPADGDEGFVHIGNGFHELGEDSESEGEILGPRVYDWRNSVARVVVRRLQ